MAKGTTEYSPDITALVDKLASDDRTKDIPRELAATAADFYLTAVERNHWTNKTQAARDAWLVKFEKTLDTLLELMADAPTTPEQWGFPARDYVLMNVAYRMGVELPHSDEQALFEKMLELEHAADAELWTLADSLKHYRKQIRLDCGEPQVLKKPADSKAARAQFIVTFHEVTNLPASQVANVVAVLFDDEVDERVVRRLIAGRTDSPGS